MKSLLLSLFFIANINCIQPTTVYLCDSTSATKYHLKETCRGLSSCQHKIIKTTLEAAKKKGKTLCKWED